MICLALEKLLSQLRRSRAHRKRVLSGSCSKVRFKSFLNLIRLQRVKVPNTLQHHLQTQVVGSATIWHFRTQELKSSRVCQFSRAVRISMQPSISRYTISRMVSKRSRTESFRKYKRTPITRRSLRYPKSPHHKEPSLKRVRAHPLIRMPWTIRTLMQLAYRTSHCCSSR